mmetsp:Transcript_22957/g.49674  ORF Transcript_22957/g.49674 Transcript_22957/m.49674 type:complete len:369 (+) Transcript_22957:177-1283(+)
MHIPLFIVTCSITITNIISAINIQPLFRRGSVLSITTATLLHHPWTNNCQQQIISPAVAFSFDTSYRASHCLGQKRAVVLSSASIGSRISKKSSSDTKNAMVKLATQSDSASAAASTDEAIKLLRRQKQSLRKEIRSRIKSTYPPTETDKLSTLSNEVFSRIFTLPEYQSAKSIGFFLSMPAGEIQTRDAIKQIVKDGKVLYVPRVGLDFEKCDMDLMRCDTTTGGADGELFYDSWPRNKWGIPEPPVTKTNVAKPGDIDLLIVPGLAFDTHGHRLGQGKGYYDRFIAKMRDGDDDGKVNDGSSENKPMLVGVCLEEQFLNEVPHGVDLGDRDDGSGGIIPVSDHDYIMDMVLTPSLSLTLSKEYLVL